MAAGTIRLTGTRLRAGVWEGVLDVEPHTGAPAIEVVHLDRPIAGLRLTPDPYRAGRFAVAVPIPADLLSDGVQTFLIRDRASGATLDSFAILAGAPLDHDIRAEIELLRAELDMLKKAFRRHCIETM
ncbi:hypothetical protein [Rhodovulum euryhalinum]|uniref:Uncharacterized protein n=1 Tax=Rhodovulum euryhalinum TaxID=35805 RepID=A0A4R2L333_9RHOB|nr:hypothetical protein [Rhodovulum euryhalinum]TCO73515.1 hypothetical protein EV655_102280 [Rhodovulum euryhalinum]